jgi:hypothetical protein
VYVQKNYGNISVKLVKTQPNGMPHWKEVGIPSLNS